MGYKIEQWDDWKNELVKLISQDPERNENLMSDRGIGELVEKLADMDDGRGAAYHLVEAVEKYLSDNE